jgi:hypothetical protein
MAGSAVATMPIRKARTTNERNGAGRVRCQEGCHEDDPEFRGLCRKNAFAWARIRKNTATANRHANGTERGRENCPITFDPTQSTVSQRAQLNPRSMRSPPRAAMYGPAYVCAARIGCCG